MFSKKRMLRWSVPVAMLVFLGVSEGWAQPAAPDPTPPPPTAAPTETAVPKENLAPKEMLSRGQDHLGEMRNLLQRVVKLREVAHKQRDLIKLNCVNDKLVQIKGHLNLAEQALTNMNESIARDDKNEAQHQHSRLSISYQKAQILHTEAEACVGITNNVAPGETSVVVGVDPSIPTGTTTTPPMLSPAVGSFVPLASQVF